MFDKVIPNKEIVIKIYALSFSTGSLYLKSADNSNRGVASKSTNTCRTGVCMIPAYTYESAVSSLYKNLLKNNDLFQKEVKILDYIERPLNQLFDDAFEMFGEKNFEEEEEEEK